MSRITSEPEIFVSEGEPTYNVNLPDAFERRGPRRLPKEDKRVLPDQEASHKQEALRALFASVSNQHLKRVDCDGLMVLITKLLCTAPGSAFGSNQRSVTEEHCQRVMSYLDRRSNGFLGYEDFCLALDIFVNRDGQPSNFHQSLLMADAWALHTEVKQLTEELHTVKEDSEEEKKHLKQQVETLRREVDELEQQNTYVLDEADTQVIDLQKQNALLKTELFRAKSSHSLLDMPQRERDDDDGAGDASDTSMEQRRSPTGTEQHGSENLEAEALREQIAVLVEQNTQLTDELEDEKARSMNLQDEVIQSSQDLREAQQKHTRAQQQVAALTADLNRLTAELRDVKKQSPRASYDLSGVGYAMALGVELQVEAMKTENGNLKKENKELRRTLERHKKDAEEKEESLKAELSRLREQTDKHRSDSTSAAANAAQLESEVRMLRSQLRAQDATTTQQKSVDSLQKEVATLNAQLKSALDEVETLRSEKQRLNAHVDKLTAKLSASREQQRKHTRRYRALETRYREQVDALAKLQRKQQEQDDQGQESEDERQTDGLMAREAKSRSGDTKLRSSSSNSSSRGEKGGDVGENGRPSGPAVSMTLGEETRTETPQSSPSSNLLPAAPRHKSAQGTHKRDSAGVSTGRGQRAVEMAARLRRLETDKARLQETVIAHKRVEVELLAEISRLHKLLSADATRKHKRAASARQPFLSLHGVLETVSKIRRQQRTAARQQMQDLVEINRTLQDAVTRSRTATATATASTNTAAAAATSSTMPRPTVTGTAAASIPLPSAPLATPSERYLYADSDRSSSASLSPVALETAAAISEATFKFDQEPKISSPRNLSAKAPVAFDVVCQPSTATYTFGLRGPCQLIMTQHELRVIHLPSRRHKFWPWTSVSRLVKDGNRVTFLLDYIGGRELELIMSTDAATQVAQSFARFLN